MQALEDKGYLIIRSVHFKNGKGKIQQAANEYLLTAKAFDAYFAMLPVASDNLDEDRSLAPENQSLPERDPLGDGQGERFQHDRQTAESDIDTIVSRWEMAIGIPVSSSEREKFTAKFNAIAQPASYFLNRIERIAAEPKLMRIARNINFLMLPVAILDDKSKLRKESEHKLVDAAPQSRPIGNELPNNDRALLHAIESQLSMATSSATRERLEILRETVSCCNFDLSLRLYKKHILHVSTTMRT
jgi:hypothetical protein